MTVHKDSGLGPEEHFVLSVLKPLLKAEDAAGLDSRTNEYLQSEPDREARRHVMCTLASFLQLLGHEDEGWLWLKRQLEEAPHDPLAQNRLAAWYYYAPRHPTREELEEALEHSLAAVEKARAANEWRRSVLHDRCRIATALQRWDVLEEAMAEILDVWADPCELDIPMFEWDWLKDVSAGAIDPVLRARYEETVDAVLEFRKQRDEIADC